MTEASGDGPRCTSCEQAIVKSCNAWIAAHQEELTKERLARGTRRRHDELEAFGLDMWVGASVEVDAPLPRQKPPQPKRKNPKKNRIVQKATPPTVQPIQTGRFRPQPRRVTFTPSRRRF